MKTTLNRRHGDINFISKNIKITGLKLISTQAFIVATGDTTGHNHVLIADKDSTLEVFDMPNGNRALRIKGTATINHPEHKTLKFPSGTWEIMRELEYDYFGKATRKVID